MQQDHIDMHHTKSSSNSSVSSLASRDIDYNKNNDDNEDNSYNESGNRSIYNENESIEDDGSNVDEGNDESEDQGGDLAGFGLRHRTNVDDEIDSRNLSARPLQLPIVPSLVKTRLTISEDQSADSQYKDRVLSLALKPKEEQVKSTKPPPAILSYGSPMMMPPSGINPHAFAAARERAASERAARERAVREYKSELAIRATYDLEGSSTQAKPMATTLSAMTQFASSYTDAKLKHSDSGGNISVDNGEVASIAPSNNSFILQRASSSSKKIHLNQETLEDGPWSYYNQEYVRDLEAKVESLENLARQQELSRLQILYRLKEETKVTTYFDCPRWEAGQNGGGHLRSSLPLSNLPLYLQKNQDIAFIVYRDFRLKEINAKTREDSFELETDGIIPPVKHTSELIHPVSVDLSNAITGILESRAEFASLLEHFEETFQVSAPYLFMYHSRHFINDLTVRMSEPSKRQLAILSEYISTGFETEYKAADSLLAKGRISARYMKYLFKPNDILVEGKEDKIRAYVSSSWPLYSKEVDKCSPNNLQKQISFKPLKSTSDKGKVGIWKIEAWSWNFDGSFRREQKNIQLRMAADSEADRDIDQLNVRPLKYVDREIVVRLQQRGKTFWDCRFRQLISYREVAGPEMQNSTDERYMIDMKTYEKLHPDQKKATQTPTHDKLNDSIMSQSAPPDEEFLFLLPLTIKGYNLRRKKWVDLQADQISEVSWNKNAFTSLVLDRKTKELIQALVSSQLAAEKSTDLISGKGNGLILLFHGGPGTGKTLTAERWDVVEQTEIGVAEIAEKPLYRVTCGDIGTEAEEVEKYLESVLNLGKTWGCVVLLDEADVFLEQRSLEDLKRNALVSVFLRVLEYYDGILILTSNRVGTFDEAFKSRIQLALHYPNLGSFQRVRVWEAFIKRLEDLGEEKVDFLDLRDHLEQLAEEKMNGREIRNAITTARQYAQWKGTTLTYDRLKDVIEIGGRFNKYIDQLNGGYTQDQLAEDEGLRLSKVP